MEFKELEALIPTANDQDARPVIALIDDDVSIRSSLGLVLRRLYRVLAFMDAPTGIAAIDDDVAAVILDIKMAGMDGFTAYRAIRQKDPDIPVIFHSAYQDIKDPYEIMNDYRPFGYITKSGDVSKLLRTVAAAVAERDRTLSMRRTLRELTAVRTQLEALKQRIK